MINSISFMKLETGAQTSPIHFNIGAAHAGSAPYGAGLQDIAMIMVQNHNHVDNTLVVNTFGAGHPYNLPTSTMISSSISIGNPSVWEALAVFTMKWVAAKRSINTTNPLFGSIDSSEFQVQSAVPNHIVPVGTVTPSATNGYGFNSSTLFSGPIAAESIKLSNDVNPDNATFLDHIRDNSIHFRLFSSPTPVSDNDHMGSKCGYLNIYDIADDSINLIDPLTVKRVSDDYFFNLFDTNEDSDLEKLAAAKDSDGNPITDISHPVLYEEGIYSWQANKLRQFKVIKADPDDLEIASLRSTLSPMDALFVGGGIDNKSVIFSQSTGTYVPTPNITIDSYMYHNWYQSGNNREYKAGIGARWVELIQTDGLVYQPTSGMSVGL